MDNFMINNSVTNKKNIINKINKIRKKKETNSNRKFLYLINISVHTNLNQSV